METAVAHSAAPPLRWRMRFEPGQAWIWSLTALLVLYLGLEGGGFDTVVRSDAAVIVWWIVLLAAVAGLLPVSRLSRSGWAALVLYGGFVAWTAIAVTWSLSSERSLTDLSLVASYLGVLILALTTYGDRRAAMRHAVGAVGCALMALVVFAVLSRLRPSMFGGANATAALLPDSHGRLGWPLNYWNGLAALVAITAPLMLSLSSSARTLAGQAAAAAALPVLCLCGYLTFSRGGAIAAAFALLAFLALAPDRLPKLATITAGGLGGVLLIDGAVKRHAVEKGYTNAAAAHQGASLLVALVIVCAGVALLQVGIGMAVRHGTRPRWMRISVGRARTLLVAGLVAVIVLGVAAGAPHRLERAWHDFKQPNSAALHQNTISRFSTLSGNGRYTYWRTAVHAMPGHWLGGFGPGTFQLVWLPRARITSYVVNAHSLYIETLTEVGIIGLALLAAFLAMLLGVAVQRASRARDSARTFAAAIAAALVSFMISAGFDWVWQIPVLPVAVLLLAAAALAGPRRPREAPAEPVRSRPAALLAARAGLALTAAAALIAIGVPLAATSQLRASQAAAASGDTSAALADARAAARVEPSSASAHLQEALVYEVQGNLAAALVQGRQAASDEPQNWEVWFVLSRLDAEAGNARQALTDYRRARSLNPQSGLFYTGGGHTHGHRRVA